MTKRPAVDCSWTEMSDSLNFYFVSRKEVIIINKYHLHPCFLVIVHLRYDVLDITYLYFICTANTQYLQSRPSLSIVGLIQPPHRRASDTICRRGAADWFISAAPQWQSSHFVCQPGRGHRHQTRGAPALRLVLFQLFLA